MSIEARAYLREWTLAVESGAETDTEEDEEEVLEQAEQSEETADTRCIDVCHEMLVSTLEAVKTGVMTPDLKQAKKWSKHLLLLMVNLVYERADNKEDVRRFIFEAWGLKFKEMTDLANEADRQARMYSEIVPCLHHSGWEQEALNMEKKILRRRSRSLRATRYAHGWDRMVAMVQAKG
jgi:hypothetical protein